MLWVGVVLVRVSQYEDDGVASEKHLADETVFVHRLRLLTLTRLRHLRPHLLHVLQYPVARPGGGGGESVCVRMCVCVCVWLLGMG